MNTPTTASTATEALPTSVRTLWRVVAMIETAVLVVVAVVVGVVTGLPLLLGGLLLVSGVFGAVSWWTIDLRYRNWRWGLDERWIERRSGVVVRTTQIVPRSRVQTLTTRTGPLDRWLGLSAIVVHTAGTHTPNLTIPHLEQSTADHIRAELGG